MQPIRKFIVRIPKAVNDVIKVGGKDLFIDSKFTEFDHRAYQGEVIGIPLLYDTGVEVGDTLYFHHHVVLGGNHFISGDTKLEEQDRRGQFIYSDSDIYYVNFSYQFDPLWNQAYAYKSKKTGEIKLLGEYIFLKPAEQEDLLTSKLLELLPQEKPPNQYGYLEFESDKTKELGLKKGDKVFFIKNGDYSMEIDGQKLYRVYLQNIYAKIPEQV